MSKFKKMLSLFLVVTMTAALAISGTLAYLTMDSGDEKNVFSIGNINVSLDEEVGVYGEGGEVKKTEDGAEYTDIMPGDYLKKEVTVYNNGKTDAYVAVTVTINNAKEINNAIDDVYGDDNAQAMYDFIFDGWGLNHSKVDAEGNKLGMRLTITGDDMPEYALQVDSVKTIDEYTLVYAQNWWESESTPTTQGEFTGYYSSKDMGTYEIRYTYYLYLPAGESSTLFNGLNVPAEFTNEQMKMFDGLEINVEAKAIQADNMAVAEEYKNDANGKAKTAFAILAGKIDVPKDYTNKPEEYAVKTEDELKEAISYAENGDIIILSNDIIVDGSAATEKLVIDKAITLDLNGKTLTTECGWGGIDAKGGCSIINGTINHTGNTAAIKAFKVKTIQNVTINVTPTEEKTKGGIVVQNGASYVNTIKNVTINGATNGIECYNSGSNPAIGTIENVKIDATQNGIWLNGAGVIGKIYNCEIKGGQIGINAYLANLWHISLNIEDSKISGGVSGIDIWDESATNTGSTVTFNYDNATTFEGGTNDIKVTLAEEIACTINGVKQEAPCNVYINK